VLALAGCATTSAAPPAPDPTSTQAQPQLRQEAPVRDGAAPLGQSDAALDFKARFLFLAAEKARAAGDNPQAYQAYKELAALYPDDLFVVRRLRDAAVAAGALDDALVQAQRLAEIAEAPVADSVLWVRLLMAKGDLDRALTLARGVTQKNPEDLGVLNLQVQVLDQMGKSEEGTNLVEAWDRRHPDGIEGLMYLAQRAFRVGEHDKVRTYLQRAVARDPDNPKPLFHLTREMFESDPSAVINLLEPFIAKHDDSQLEEYLARAYWSQGRREEARALFKKMTGYDEVSPVTYLALALMAQEDGRAEESLQWLEKIPPELRQTARITYYEGVTRQMLGHRDEAIAIFKSIPKGQDDLYDQAQIRLIDLLLESKQYDQARQVLEANREGLKERLFYYLAWSDLETSLEHPDQALLWIEEGIKAIPDNLDLIFQRAVLSDRLQRWEEAEAAFKQVIAGNPEQVEALNYLAYSYALRGQHLDEALSLIERALNLKPTDAYVDTKAWILFKMGQFKQAKQVLAPLMAQEQTDPILFEHWGSILESAGETLPAIAAFRRAQVLLEENGTSEGTLEAMRGRLAEALKRLGADPAP